MTYFLGVDLGTSSLKMMLKSADGSKEYIASKAYQFASPKNGYAEHDSQEWWEACKIGFAELENKYEVNLTEIEAISFSGQMHGLIALDENKEIIRPSILHCDARSDAQIKLMSEKIEKKTQIEILRNPFYTGFLLPSLLWVKENEYQNYQKIKHVMLPKDYLIFMLTNKFATDFSDASGTLAFDVVKQTWSEVILKKFDIPMEWFPPCYEIGTKIAKVDPERAKEIGLSPNTIIVMGGGDQIMQGIGNALLAVNQTSVNIGTSAQVSFQTDKPIQNENLNTNLFCGYKKDRWVSVGAIMNAGLSYSWLCKLLTIDNLEEMNQKIATLSNGSNGLIFLPYLTGERTPHMNPNLSGAFVGLDVNTTRTEMARSVMEGVVYALNQCLELCKKLGLELDYITASGGATNSKTWLQIQSNVFNLPIKTTKCKEQACLGAVISAAVGAGYFKDFSEACAKFVEYEEEMIYPDEEAHEEYLKYYEQYKELQNNLIPTLENITLLGRK